MITFIKAQLNSVISTLVDFVVTLLLAEVFGLWYLGSSICGALAGGICNFILGRSWVFNARGAKVQAQLLRYVLVWAGSIFLNTAGLWLFTEIFGIRYILSKIIITVAVGIGYNFVLQKTFVFKLQS